MIRRTLFLGLTLFLVVVLVALIIRNQNRETEEPVGGFNQPDATSIRVFAPDDLRAAILRTEFETDGSARHEIELRNTGAVTYDEFRISIRYYEQAGKQIANREQILRKDLGPGATERFEDIRIEDVPGTAARQEIRILSAEMSTEAE